VLAHADAAVKNYQVPHEKSMTVSANMNNVVVLVHHLLARNRRNSKSTSQLNFSNSFPGVASPYSGRILSGFSLKLYRTRYDWSAM
jgi:hypothetical protein